MLYTETLRSCFDKRRIQITVRTNAATSLEGLPILLGWVNVDVWSKTPAFNITLCDVWLEGVEWAGQPCSSFADGLRWFVAVERLIARHGLEKASQMLKTCQQK